LVSRSSPAGFRRAAPRGSAQLSRFAESEPLDPAGKRYFTIRFDDAGRVIGVLIEDE